MSLVVNTILQGHVIDRLADIPNESVNCTITSVPYWALRAYGTEPQVWGGDRGCQHNWIEHRQKPPGGIPKCETTIDQWKQQQEDGAYALKGQDRITNTCSLCGAWRGELGLEPTPELYIDHLMMVFDGVKRVLHKDGVLFVNIADTYGTHTSKRSGQLGVGIDINSPTNKLFLSKRPDVGLEKSLCAIPERFVLAMMAHGWIRRCTIIWAKGLSFCPTYAGSCMPDSCKDRPNKNAFEYLFMFTKSTDTTFWVHNRKMLLRGKQPEPDYIYIHKRTQQEYDYPPPIWSKKLFKKLWNRRNLWQGHDYYYEQQYEEVQELNAERPRMGQGNQTIYNQKRSSVGWGNTRANDPKDKRDDAGTKIKNDTGTALGRTIRNVWAINPQPYPEAHFATFPEKLVEPLIKMGTPEFVCKKCGKARVKIIDISYEKIGSGTCGGRGRFNPDDKSGFTGKPTMRKIPTEIGLTDCGCNAGFRPGVVADPFLVAARPPKSLQGSEGTGLVLNSRRSISKWQIAA